VGGRRTPPAHGTYITTRLRLGTAEGPTMLRFLIRRVLLSIVTLFAVSVTTFLLFFAVPQSPAASMCGAKNCPPEIQARIIKDLGLDRPLYVQYGEYMKGIFAGRTIGHGQTAIQCPAPCLGVSFRTSRPALDLIKQGFPVTASIVIGAAVVYLSLGIGLGTSAALRRASFVDRFAVGFSMVGASTQIYVLGPILTLLLVYQLGWLSRPTFTPFSQDPGAWFLGLLLPWITLGLINSASYTRLSRAQMLETLSEDFVRTARAKGASPRAVNYRHALRAAITPVMTIAGLDLGLLLGGVVIVESVFSMPGVGLFSITAINNQDLPVVMATVLLAAVLIVVFNVIVDVLYAVVDPRVKLS
jgi:peptide/nickel transport system permease protein